MHEAGRATRTEEDVEGLAGELRAREACLRVLAAHADIGFARIGLGGEWLTPDERCCALLGYSREELLRMRVHDITHPDDLAEGEALADRLRRGEIPAYAREKRHLQRDGSAVWSKVSVSLVLGPRGEPASFLAMIEDITGKRSLARERDQAIARAQSEAAHRERVLAIVSHDLRAPLHTIRMASTLLARDHQDATTPRRIDTILHATARMSRLLCDLVDARSFLQGTVPLDLGRHLLALVLEEAVDDFELEAAARDITVRTTLHVPDDTLVACDRERLLQVLANLLGNAIKFSERGAEIEIRVRSAGARLEFDVSDRGAGIPAEDLPHVFEPYWTKSSTRQRGTGLGLAIVRSIVTAHGGDVRVASEVGVGTTFTFTMPADQPPA